MNIFKDLITKVEKKHIEARNIRYFESCLTDAEKKYYKEKEHELSNLFCANYDDLLGYKWHMNSDSSMLYKVDEKIKAYLIRSDKGYIIDPDALQSQEAIEAEEYLLIHAKDILNNLYKHVVEYEELHSRDWETKPGIDREAFEVIAASLGYMKKYEEKEKSNTK